MSNNIPLNWRPRTIRNVTLAILRMFKGKKFLIYEKTGVKEPIIAKEIDCPVKYAHYDKLWASEKMRETVGGSGVQYYRPVPSIVVSLSSPQYDSSRHKSKNINRYFVGPTSGSADPQEISDPTVTTFLTSLAPVPYNLYFDVTLNSRSMEMVNQFLEDVLPNFDPNRYIRIREFSFLNIERDLKVSLESVANSFGDEQAIDGIRRDLDVTLTLKVEAYLYKPFDDAGIIKKINSNYIITNDSEAETELDSFGTSFITSGSPEPEDTLYTVTGQLPENLVGVKIDQEVKS